VEKVADGQGEQWPARSAGVALGASFFFNCHE